MKTIVTKLAVALASVLAMSVCAAQSAAPPAARAGAPAAAPMTLTTTGWMDGDVIPVKYTQAVRNPVSPALVWTNVPAGTQSLVLHFHDPDVSKDKTTADQVHWLMWNMPPTLTGLSENVPMGAELPDGSRQISASGQVYRGPGAAATGPYHHYTFEIYALDIKLDSIQPAANELDTRVKVFAAMQGHVLGKAVMFGLFRRPPA